jgi:putative transcriptional regulator
MTTKKTVKRTYKSDLLASVHEAAEGLARVGIIDKKTMREFDEACLTPVRPLKAKEILALREREGASQAVFARYLNVSPGVVTKWERGEKHPIGASLKLLSLVAKKGLSAIA